MRIATVFPVIRSALKLQLTASASALTTSCSSSATIRSWRSPRRSSDAAGSRARKVRVLAFDGGSRHGEEPPFEICSAMAEATVIFAPTTFSLSHTEARQEATRRGIRIATMPGITEEVFRRALDVDYGELKRAGEWLAAQLLGRVFVPRDGAGRDRSADRARRPVRHLRRRRPVGRRSVREPAGGRGVHRAAGDLRRGHDRVRRRVGRLRAARGSGAGGAVAAAGWSTSTARSASGWRRPWTPAASTAGRSPSSASARTRRRGSPGTSSRTRRRWGRSTSRSARARRSAASTARRCTSTAWCCARPSSSTAACCCEDGNVVS